MGHNVYAVFICLNSFVDLHRQGDLNPGLFLESMTGGIKYYPNLDSTC